MDQRHFASLSRAFLMHKVPSPTNDLIFRKNLIHPIVLTQQNSLDFLSIAGWKSWSTSFITSMLGDKFNERDFLITATVKGIDENVTVLFIPVPSYLFTFIDNDKICDHIQKLMFQHLSPTSVVFDMRDEGFLFFQILDVNLEISFSPFLCKFFGFSPDVSYSAATTIDQVFTIPKGYRDFRGSVVGISLNFVYNPDLSQSNDNEIKKYEIISLLDTTETSFSAYYKKILITQPEHNIYKSLSCQQLELRFIDLSTGKVLSSFFPNDYPQEINVKISFS